MSKIIMEMEEYQEGEGSDVFLLAITVVCGKLNSENNHWLCMG